MPNTVKGVIKDFLMETSGLALKQRIERLTELNAPSVVIQKSQEQLDMIRNEAFKVKGMAVKHKVANVPVTEFGRATTYGFYYNGYRTEKKPTTVLKIVTENETYYYDQYDNKIGVEGEVFAVTAGHFPNHIMKKVEP